MEYLKRVLGIEVLYENKALEHLPNFISTRYDSQKVSLSGQKAVFLYPKTELEQVETLKKHLERVKKVADCPVILVLEQITARQKEYLLREKIAFIVDGKQIYLPFMAAYLQERCDAEKSDREEILPSAQIITLKMRFPAATTWTPTGWKPNLMMALSFPSTVSPLRTNTATPLRSEQNWTGYYTTSPWSMPGLC